MILGLLFCTDNIPAVLEGTTGNAAIEVFCEKCTSNTLHMVKKKFSKVAQSIFFHFNRNFNVNDKKLNNIITLEEVIDLSEFVFYDSNYFINLI